MNKDATHPTEFSGIWLSEYTYHSTARDKDLTSRHYVRIVQEGNTLVVESLPGMNDGYVIMRLSMDGSVLTGSWQEHTAPEGDYGGAVYYGAIQMVLDADRRAMEGKWVGFGKRMDIKSGPWKIRYYAADNTDLPPLSAV